MRGKVLSEPALVGRELELVELMNLLGSANEGKGSTVFVSGEAGSGKTKLINEFLKVAKQKTEVTVLTGLCLSNAAIPYLPFVEAFNSYFSSKETGQTENTAAEVNAWLSGARQSEKSGMHGYLPAQAWKELTFAAVTKALSSISANKTVILIIEDLHWADSASLSLLHFVARAMRSEKVLLLATFRSEELLADMEGQEHPLADQLRMMSREGLYVEIKLSKLDKACVGEIAENMMGGKLNPELVVKLSEESRGNALFVVESLRMLSERGSLYLENNEWRLAVDEMGIPGKFKDIVLHRLSLLKFNQRRVLDAASVIGEKFDVELLSAVLSQDSLEVLETLNTLERSTSLIRVDESFFRFDHAKLRQAIYEEITLPLKKGYHRRVAEKLENSSINGRFPFGEIAYHYAEAGNEEKAVKFALEAGKDALAKFSNPEAVKHFDYVLKTLDSFPENAAVRSLAMEGLGDAYYANGKFAKALETFELLASFEKGIARLRAYRKALDASSFGPVDKKCLLELASQAEPYSTCDRLEYARIRFRKSMALPPNAGGEKERSAALQVFEEEYSLFDIAKALSVRSGISFYGGSVKKGLADSLLSFVLQKELHGDSGELALTSVTSALVFMNAGLVQESMLKCAEILRVGEKIGDYKHSAEACVLMNRFIEAQGRIEEALFVSLKGIKYYEETDASRRQDRVWADLGRQYAKLGNLPRAEEYIKQMARVDPQHLPYDPEGLLNIRDLLRTKAVFFAVTNRWNEAYECLEKALMTVKKVPVFNTFSKIVVRTDYAWVLNKQGRTDEARVHLDEIRRLYDEVDGNFAQVELDANFLAPKNVFVGEDFEVRLDLVNVSRRTGLLVRVEEFVPPEFTVVDPEADGHSPNVFIDLKEKKIGPFEVETIKLRLNCSEPDTYTLSLKVTYVDEARKTRTCVSNPAIITVKPTLPKFEILPDRVSTGFEDLDALLFGGIPEKQAIVLVAPSIEEREQLVKRFLAVGGKSGEPTFFITVEPGMASPLIEKYSSSFFLFVCNPQADALAPNLPNVFKLKGVESLTGIEIELVKAFRKLNPLATEPRRICLEVISDALLQHHAVTTRRWLSALLPTLKSKGFTVLGVVDSQLHPPEELQAILGLFDGEIRVFEREITKGTEKVLKIRKLYNQKYLEDELILTREKLRQSI